MTSIHANPHVLLVDDEPRIVALMTRVLVAQGLGVTGHTDPVVAWDAFRNQPDAFDIVVVDFEMPDLPGLELARRVSRCRPGIPIVLLSGYAEAAAPQELVSAGIRECLLKPVSIRRLSTAIVGLLHPTGSALAGLQPELDTPES